MLLLGSYVKKNLLKVWVYKIQLLNCFILVF